MVYSSIHFPWGVCCSVGGCERVCWSACLCRLFLVCVGVCLGASVYMQDSVIICVRDLGFFLRLVNILSVDQKQIKVERQTYSDTLSLSLFHSHTHMHTHTHTLIRAVKTEKLISLKGGTGFTGRRH